MPSLLNFNEPTINREPQMKFGGTRDLDLDGLSPSEAIQAINELMQELPVDAVDATINVQGGDDYTNSRIYVEWLRRETLAEAQTRIQNQLQWAQTREQARREQYERLRAEFEGE